MPSATTGEGSTTRQLTFVNFSHPSSKDTQTRRLVRSRATTYSHRDPNRKPKASRRTEQRRPNERNNVRPTSDDVPSPPEQWSSLFEASERLQLERKARAANKKQDTKRYLLDGGNVDPFDALPVPNLPWFSWVMEYYRNVHLPPGIALVQSTPKEGTAYVNWQLREAVSEPALFYMQLLNGCTPLVVEGRVPQAVVIWLRSMVVSYLNEAIRNPQRSFSTPVLLTVASIALHERLYGDKHLALEVHGRAMGKMMALRGGIRTLDVPRIGFRLLQWTDSILSTGNAHKTTADLLAAWAPQSLRLRHPGYDSPTTSSPCGEGTPQFDADQPTSAHSTSAH